MANTKSAIKNVRVSKRKQKINSNIKKSFRLARKEVIVALEAKDANKIDEKLSKAYKQIDFAVKKGTLKKNTGARYKSRLAKQVAVIKKA